MVKVIMKYDCEVCGSTHASEGAAEKCEARGVLDYEDGKLRPEVGDLVHCGEPYGWNEATDSAWVEERDPEVDKVLGRPRMMRAFHHIFVVTAKTSEDHRVRYHLHCPASVTGMPLQAWTGPHHIRCVGLAEDYPRRAELDAWLEKNEEFWRGRTSDRLL